MCYTDLSQKSIAGEMFSDAECRDILVSSDIRLLSLLDAAFTVREKFFGKTVLLHILNNVQNGLCSEDCQYCVQSKASQARIEEYPMKSDDEILAEAEEAHRAGAFRYCMVLAGRQPSPEHIARLVRLIIEIKKRYAIEVCVSPGMVDRASLAALKDAGLNRLNHNLNTAREHYPKICTTHTYDDRLNTLTAAHEIGLEICSGVIIGMGESTDNIIEMAKTLRECRAESIPVNFFMPIEGVPLSQTVSLTPEYCLRVLCLFRLLNPHADIRIAAGRELYLRTMQAFALYPANSLFIDGYLNAKGDSRVKTLRMIRDAGFTISSEYSLDEILCKEEKEIVDAHENSTIQIKRYDDLHPTIRTTSM